MRNRHGWVLCTDGARSSGGNQVLGVLGENASLFGHGSGRGADWLVHPPMFSLPAGGGQGPLVG